LAGLKLLAEHPGYHILLRSRNTARGEATAAKLQAEELSVEAITIDLTSDESISSASKTVEAKFDRLDVLINNAGIAMEGSNRDVMSQTFKTNVFGPIQIFEKFTPLLEKGD
jgi:NAD(P)-dependent dehydrogenase (short-subunit alcohol dehydrogenase family)